MVTTVVPTEETIPDETIDTGSTTNTMKITDNQLEITVDSSINIQLLVENGDAVILAESPNIIINKVVEGDTLKIYINDNNNVEYFDNIDYSKIKHIIYIFNTKNKINISRRLKTNIKNNLKTMINKPTTKSTTNKKISIFYYIIPIIILLIIIIYLSKTFLFKTKSIIE